MDEKKRKTLLITIFIFICIIASILCLLTHYKPKNDVKPKENTNDKPNNNKPTILITDEELNAIKDKISKYYLFGLKYYDEELSFNESELTNPMLEILYAYVDKKLVGNDIDNYFKDLYNFIPSERKPFVCGLDNEDLLSYDTRKKTYYINEKHTGHGGKIYNYNDLKVISAKQENNIYTVSIVFFYGSNAEGYYLNDSEFNISLDAETENYDDLYKNEFNKLNDFSKIKKYTYTFEKIDDNYYLKGFSKTN